MADVEKVIRILEGGYKNFVIRHNGELITVNELLALLKEQSKQYENGWNDAMDYAFRHGNGYRPYVEGVNNDDCGYCI